MKKQIKVNLPDRTIVGTLFLPEHSDFLTEDGRYPVVIVSHGFNAEEEDFYPQSEVLAEYGFAVVTYDFCGGSTRSKSSMPMTFMSVETEQEDLRAVMDYIEADPQFDPKRLFLFGESQGGLVSALTAEKYEKEIRALALLYPALCIPDDQRRDYPVDDEIPEIVDFWDVKLGKRYFTDAKKIDVFKDLGSYSRPVLFMHGLDDQVVNISYSERAVLLYRDARLEIYPGEGHGFSPKSAPAMRIMTAEFFKQFV